MGHGPALVYTSGIHLKSHVGRRRNGGDAGGRQTQLCTSVTLRTVGLQLWENVLFQLCDQCFPLLRCDTVFSLKHRDIRRRLVVLISIYAPPTLLHSAPGGTGLCPQSPANQAACSTTSLPASWLDPGPSEKRRVGPTVCLASLSVKGHGRQ